VSRHSQIIAISDVSGSEASRPPQPGFLRATSEIAAISKPDTAAFTSR
jgi:hypothetical protein